MKYIMKSVTARPFWAELSPFFIFIGSQVIHLQLNSRQVNPQNRPAHTQNECVFRVQRHKRSLDKKMNSDQSKHNGGQLV